MFPGIHAIAYALFHDDETLDRAAMRRQTEICLAAGVDGMAALGLATEVSKLREAERRSIMDWVAEDVAGRVPVAFTIYGNSVAEQVAQIRHAEGVQGRLGHPAATERRQLRRQQSTSAFSAASPTRLRCPSRSRMRRPTWVAA